MLIIRRLSKQFGKTTAVDRVFLETMLPQNVVIMGPSGSGKTTLLRLIAGLEVPDEGEIYINGALASKPGWILEPCRRNLGFVFQRPALWPHMTVAQNILFGLGQLPRREARQRLHHVLDHTKLMRLADRYPDELSGGEARRAAIARSLAPCPRYLLMDEPLTNLDPELKQEMLSFIRNTAQATQASLIYVTHDPGEAEAIADRIVRLADGRVLSEKGNQQTAN